MDLYVLWVEDEPDPAGYFATRELAAKRADELELSKFEMWIEKTTVEIE